MKDLNGEDWTKVQALFDELIDLKPEERDKRLRRSKVSPDLLAHVTSLLDAASSDGIFEMSPPDLSLPDPATGYSSLAAGEEIGAFTIDRLIGRGGMGEVYLAHRTSTDFEQRVALKMLRAEAAEQGGLFDRERRVLARLEHRGIARLIDGGIGPDGRPYMAMEYVEGEPIDAWCRRTGADLDTRLRLFREICDAVGYAHANLVIHRDLKPSNILIDTAGRVRLLDFGIARLLDDSAAAPMATQAILTPDYAAPEQLGGGTATVAADVYALGVILFELVTGAGPWHREGASVPSIIRRVLHEDPPLPSKTADRVGAPIASGRIAGDLDAIILKAMRRSPQERYRGAIDLADDLRRHQELRPVQARAGSTRYMVGRFVRRYRWAVTASAAAIVAILVGAGGIAWQARQTAIERDVALDEARRSDAINRMLTVMFRDTAETDAGADATVKQMLDKTAERLVGSLDNSARSATLITTLSDLYVNLEDAAGADVLLRRALARGIGGNDAVATAEIKLRLASSAAAMNKSDDMAPLLDAADAVFRTDPARFRTERLEVIGGRAQLARRGGDYDSAIRLLADAMPEADRVYVENHRDLLTLYNNLLVYMVEANRLDAMPAVFAQADAALKRTGLEKSTQGLAIMQLKGIRLLKLDEVARAEVIFERVAAQRKSVFGPSAGLAADLGALGRAKLALGKFDEARRVLAEARPIATEYVGQGALSTLVIGLGLAEAMAETGDVTSADKVVGEVAPLVTAIAKPGLPHAMLARTQAIVRLKQGRLDEASAALDRSEAIIRAMGPAGAANLKGFPPIRARIASAR
ncbi:serine/threonine protein kinase [Sphingomonas alpina]|uniref:Serine/threonine protein kinase n=1 Tax=Sphingomonas alpina TaxID=653931 RepID=A0A7H0LJD6_9SPHN|nr:serine/threonine-protein kinase [Sphingomonas alpina]QNQ09789.1 serine/threonine protein kinase [Sphingomonas alpina]